MHLWKGRIRGQKHKASENTDTTEECTQTFSRLGDSWGRHLLQSFQPPSNFSPMGLSKTVKTSSMHWRHLFSFNEKTIPNLHTWRLVTSKIGAKEKRIW